LKEELKEKGSKYMFEKLKRIDPKYDRKIHQNNTKYVLRAIEVKFLTGKSKSEFKEEKVLSYDTLFFTPYDGDRQKLYERIDKRVEGMFEEGLVEEVQNLMKIS
jgi:tRNA dimethylallyltransferase